MEKEFDYQELLNRLGFFMNKANLSARATSLKLGYSEQFMKRILNGSVDLKVSTLLDIFRLLDITPQDFFYLGKQYNKDDKNILELFSKVSPVSKEATINILKQLK